MPVSYAPEPLPFSMVNYYSLFLAGSIEMGLADNWQDEACNKLGDIFEIYNPRRNDWNTGWDNDSAELYQQITWEQERMLDADFVLFYFDPKTKSPITLLELGQCLQIQNKKIIVVCPDGFWRKSNVVITCNRYKVPVDNNLDTALEFLNVIGSNKLMADANKLNSIEVDYRENQLVNKMRAKHEQKSQLS